MKGTLFSILVLVVVAGFALSSGCTGSGSTASTENLGTVTDHATLDGIYDANEAKYFKDFELQELFNNGNPYEDEITFKPFVDKFVFAVGSDGVYFFEHTTADGIKGFKGTEPGWMIIKTLGVPDDLIKLDFYSGEEAFHMIKEEEGGSNRYKIPSDRWYDIDAKIKTNSDGSMSVEGISTDPALVKAILDLGPKISVIDNAGTYYGTIEDVLN